MQLTRILSLLIVPLYVVSLPSISASASTDCASACAPLAAFHACTSVSCACSNTSRDHLKTCVNCLFELDATVWTPLAVQLSDYNFVCGNLTNSGVAPFTFRAPTVV